GSGRGRRDDRKSDMVAAVSPPERLRGRSSPEWAARAERPRRIPCVTRDDTATHVDGQPDARKRLFLLDGHSLAYRAFFALPPTLATTTGQVTNAVYGFTSMLIKLLTDERPDLIAVAFDKGPPTVRLEKYADYKARRAETPGDLRPQT